MATGTITTASVSIVVVVVAVITIIVMLTGISTPRAIKTCHFTLFAIITLASLERLLGFVKTGMIIPQFTYLMA